MQSLCPNWFAARGQPPERTDAQVRFGFLGASLSDAFPQTSTNSTTQLSRSQSNPRPYAFQNRWQQRLGLLATWAKVANSSVALACCPLPGCKTIRIRRSRLVKEQTLGGYNASKREYYFGYKIQLITAADGRIVEFDRSAGAVFTRPLSRRTGF